MGRLVVPKGEAGYLTRFERFNSDMMFSTTLQSKHCDGVTYPVALRVPRTLNIKNQKSRWGSCGIHNDIQINALLIIAPPAVLEYVVVHELCHIQICNHSPQFWALVADHLPDYKTPHHWLKQHGNRLMQGF